MICLDASVETLPGIGRARARLLENVGIRCVRDLAYHFPRQYEDRRCIVPIAQVAEGQSVTIEGTVVNARSVRLRGRMSLAVVTLCDGTGEMNATWFGRGFLAKAFVQGCRGVFTGQVGKYQGLALRNPEYEMLSGDAEDRIHTGRIVPIYRLTEKLSQRMVRQCIWNLLELLGRLGLEGVFPEALPPEILERYGFPGAGASLWSMHFPREMGEVERARSRFVYEELLGVQLGVLQERAVRLGEENGIRHCLDGPLLKSLRGKLPFVLTGGQARAVQDILSDMASSRPMVRLVQGDVGCGKTVVALHGIVAAADGLYQTALMAPTEVLAEQHFRMLREMLEPMGLWVELLTGSRPKLSEIRRRIAQGEAHVVVGTHALFQEKTVFRNLGLVIIDEQHRFGVCQRGRLVEKGMNPDILHMTATPIPRTLAITVYGGMDVSIIDEMPPGRLPVKTRRIPSAKVADLHRYIVEQARLGFQTYYICPLVEESDKRELKAVTTHFEELSGGVFAGIRTALMHGRLGPEEKDDIMRRFKAKLVDVLFSTTVIEVGVDVPTATIIVIEDAADFGLTQLHQLRGRVGRGSEQSFCFLLGKPSTEEGLQRLEALCAMSSGFDIAEADLKLRGPGEFNGVRQAGLSDLRVADLLGDVRWLDLAHRDAGVILGKDPLLTDPGHRLLAEMAARFASLTV